MKLFRKKAVGRYSSANLQQAKKSILTSSSPFATKEAYNAIRTKLMFTGKGEDCPVFAVTSAMAHDGKSTNAANLAISIANAGKKVLLIDADMRKPSIHGYLGLENKNGLSEILAGLTKEVRLSNTQYENLYVLTGGQIPPNPAELLGSRQMETLLDYVKKFVDYVIIDTPPINVVTDAAVLAEKVTGYVFVVQSGKNHYNELSYALDTLEEMNANVVGIILNDVQGKSSSKYGYGRNSGYHRSYNRHRYGYGNYGYGNYGYGNYGYGYGGYGAYGGYGYDTPPKQNPGNLPAEKKNEND